MRKYTLALPLLALVQVSISGAAILMHPYLQALTPTSVYVLVETNRSAAVTVEYGTTADCALSASTESVATTTADPVTYVHRIALRNLSPETAYYYRAGEGSTFTAISRFRTGVLPGTSFRFSWMADCRTGSEIFDSVVTHVASANPLFGLFGGDLSVNGSYDHWKAQFFRPALLAFASTVPWVNAPGNHEGWETNTQAFTHAPVGSPNEDYFSFDCGDLHVLVLDSESPLTPGSPQAEFADRDLAASRRTWKIAMLHKPAYCSGGHGEDDDIIAFTTAVLEKRGVDMVLAGHSHFYQHNVVHGIHHMVIGSAGSPLYDPSDAVYTLKSVKQYNWAVCDVTPETLNLHVYNEGGVPLDSVLLTKQAGKEPLK